MDATWYFSCYLVLSSLSVLCIEGICLLAVGNLLLEDGFGDDVFLFLRHLAEKHEGRLMPTDSEVAEPPKVRPAIHAEPFAFPVVGVHA